MKNQIHILFITIAFLNLQNTQAQNRSYLPGYSQQKIEPLSVNYFDKLNESKSEICKTIFSDDKNKKIQILEGKRTKAATGISDVGIFGAISAFLGPFAGTLLLNRYFLVDTSYLTTLVLAGPPLYVLLAFINSAIQTRYFDKKHIYSQELDGIKRAEIEYVSNLNRSISKQLASKNLMTEHLINHLRKNFLVDFQKTDYLLLGVAQDQEANISKKSKIVTSIMKESIENTKIENVEAYLGKNIHVRQKLIIADDSAKNIRVATDSALYAVTGRLVGYEVKQQGNGKIIRLNIETLNEEVGYVDIPYGLNDYKEIRKNKNLSYKNNIHKLSTNPLFVGNSNSEFERKHRNILSYYYISEVNPEKQARLDKIYGQKSKLISNEVLSVDYLLGAYNKALIVENRRAEIIGLVFEVENDLLNQLQILSDPTIENTSEVYLKASKRFNDPKQFEIFDTEFVVTKLSFSENNKELIHFKRISDNKEYILPMSIADWMRVRSKFKRNDYRYTLAKTIKNSVPSWSESQKQVNENIQKIVKSSVISDDELEKLTLESLKIYEEPIRVPEYLNRF